MKRLLSLPLLCLALSFGLTACDSGGSNDGETEIKNEFSLDVNPESSSARSVTAKALRDTTIDGFSFFYSGENRQGEEVFGIYLSGNESFSSQSAQDGLFGFLARNSSELPDTGEHDIVTLEQGFDSGDFISVLFEDLGTDGFQDAPFYVPQGGTVEFSTSTEDEVSGNVNIPTAYAITVNTSAGTLDTTEVSISGSFTAKSVDTFAPLTTP